MELPSPAPKRKRISFKKLLLSILITLVVLVVGGIIAFRISPWPSVLLIRYAFDKGAMEVSDALEKHVPDGITAVLNEQYDKTDKEAFLDIYYPSSITKTDSMLPAVVWIHGGGLVSGNKEQVGNYAKILSSKGYTVVSIDYSIAPGAKYPTPVKQANAALGYLSKNAKRFHINAAKFILAGDSGGSHIGAQVACITTDPSYAAQLNISPLVQPNQLAGMLLFCGIYNVKAVNMEGSFGGFFKTVLWAYSGGKDFMTNPAFATASVTDYVTSTFPKSFISAGNSDPLESQSLELANKLGSLGVKVDSLFFPKDHLQKQQHEYQFNLDSEEGKQALERAVQFLKAL